MKLLISALAFFAASSAFAETVVCKQLDAQVIAHVESIKPLEGTGLCQAQLSFEGKHDMYNENTLCALPYDEVIARGVAMKCKAQVGDQVEGILYRSVFDTQIYLY